MAETLDLGNVDPSLGNARVPMVGEVYAVLATLESGTGMILVDEREEITTGNQQLLYLIFNKVINILSADQNKQIHL